MKKPILYDAVYALVGGELSGSSTYNSFIYHNGQTPPTEAEAKTKLTELTEDWTAQAYARARKAEYDVLNQFELISDDSANNTTTHVDAIAAIKLKHPKS